MKATKTLFIIAMVVLLSACGRKDGTFYLVAQDMTPAAKGVHQFALGPATFTDAGGTTFTATEARINVRHIQMDSTDGDQVSIDGPLVFNVLTGTASGGVADFAAKKGTYKRVDVRIDDSNVTDGILDPADPLVGNSLYITGTHDYGTGGNFTLVLKFNEDIRFEDPNGVEITDDGSAVLLSLNMAEWMTGVNITTCLETDITVDINGDFVIDDNSPASGACNAIEGDIKSNMKNNYDLK